MYSSSIILFSIISTSTGFSSFGGLQSNRQYMIGVRSQSMTNFVPTRTRTSQLFSTPTPPPPPSENNEPQEPVEPETPTPITDSFQQQSAQFTSEPAPQKRLDPLVASLTRMDEEMANTPTTKVPLLGEIPLDGSIVVLLPVALIAVVGFIMSINIAFNSKDLLSEKLDEVNVAGKMSEVNAAMSKPPVMKSKDYDGCRGLCSDQGEQLENMRNFMNSLAPNR